VGKRRRAIPFISIILYAFTQKKPIDIYAKHGSGKEGTVLGIFYKFFK
jgi:hypothetical protein